MLQNKKIVPIILAGGQGSRLWPVSKPDLPKQFLPLKAGGTTFDNTCRRVADSEIFKPPVIVTSIRYRGIIEEQYPHLSPLCVYEPVGRNTGPAAYLATRIVQETYGNDVYVLILPADHYIPDVKSFCNTIVSTTGVVNEGYIVTYGISPLYPHKEYGYIRFEEPGYDGTYQVLSFTEKPDEEVARQYCRSGQYLWNSGILSVRADVLIAEFQSYQAEVCRLLERALKQGEHGSLCPKSFAECPKISIDIAILERTKKAVVKPASFQWSDLGGWDALMEFAV